MVEELLTLNVLSERPTRDLVSCNGNDEIDDVPLNVRTQGSRAEGHGATKESHQLTDPTSGQGATPSIKNLERARGAACVTPHHAQKQ